MSGLDGEYASSGCESDAFFHNSLPRERWGAPRRRKQIKGLRLQALISGICLRAQIERGEIRRVVGLIYLRDSTRRIKATAIASKVSLFTAWTWRWQRRGSDVSRINGLPVATFISLTHQYSRTLRLAKIIPAVGVVRIGTGKLPKVILLTGRVGGGLFLGNFGGNRPVFQNPGKRFCGRYEDFQIFL